MVDEIYTLSWTDKSQKQMKEAYEYISENSVSAAQKVINEIADAVEKATSNPEMYCSINTKSITTEHIERLSCIIIVLHIGLKTM